jgi:hypothetical protein
MDDHKIAGVKFNFNQKLDDHVDDSSNPFFFSPILMKYRVTVFEI